MKVVIAIVLVLFAYITIGGVDAITCYGSVCGILGGEGAEDCKDDFTKNSRNLTDCKGYCFKNTVVKTGEFFLTMNSGLELELSVN